MSIVTVTDSAKKHMENILSKEGREYVMLMIKGGGCAGFSYNWSTVDVEKVKENDEIIPLSNGNFVIDGTSLMFVAGTTIDYKEEVFGSYMTISNPNVKSSCGCGESFGV